MGDPYLIGTYQRDIDALKDLRRAVCLVAAEKGLGESPRRLVPNEAEELQEISARLNRLTGEMWLSLVARSVRGSGLRL